jgi:hypothetical protein
VPVDADKVLILLKLGLIIDVGEWPNKKVVKGAQKSAGRRSARSSRPV